MEKKMQKKKAAENSMIEDDKATESLVQQQELSNLIYTIRGQQVMLDRDLAKLYGVETKQLNRQVKRNIDRFPSDFIFELSIDELENLRCQIGTSSWGGNRYKQYAFTENGIAMLSSVLRSKTAIEVNIKIMRAFTIMRKFISNTAHFSERLTNVEYKLIDNDKKFEDVFRRLESTTFKLQRIFYDGQIFDAYLFVTELIKKASKRVILIDNYIDATVLAS